MQEGRAPDVSNEQLFLTTFARHHGHLHSYTHLIKRPVSHFVRESAGARSVVSFLSQSDVEVASHSTFIARWFPKSE